MYNNQQNSGNLINQLESSPKLQQSPITLAIWSEERKEEIA